MNSLIKPASSFLQSTTTLANSAFKAVTSASNVVSSSTTTLEKNISKAINSGFETVNDTFHDVVNSSSTALKNLPILNSIVTNSKNGLTGTNGSKNGVMSLFNSATGGTGGTGGTGSNGPSSSNNFSKAASSGWMYAAGVFLFLVLIFVAIFTLFSDQIKIGLDNIIATLRRTFNQPSTTVTADSLIKPPADPTPVPSQSDIATENAMASKNIINKLLPLGQKEVFNVSSNNYTFYDAEPLCRALGAELATYSQVKDAWEKGADWCNYGWVKGQAAVYPTQKGTWDKLQHGPEDEKYACGNPGVNGGYFDNPEMRFGVSCYGVKPSESSNNEKNLMARGTVPKSPATLKVDQQIQEYKDSLDTIGVLPFSSDNWSE